MTGVVPVLHVVYKLETNIGKAAIDNYYHPSLATGEPEGDRITALFFGPNLEQIDLIHYVSPGKFGRIQTRDRRCGASPLQQGDDACCGATCRSFRRLQFADKIPGCS